VSSLVDRDALLESVDGDLEFLEETAELLESDGRRLLAEMRAASEAGDQNGLIQNAHGLKGMVANFCAQSVQRAAGEIEHAAREGALDGLAEKVNDFAISFDRLCRETQAIASGEEP
jgi:HPt (histidine-containing phosphotransfer) domain-containing protein